MAPSNQTCYTSMSYDNDTLESTERKCHTIGTHCTNNCTTMGSTTTCSYCCNTDLCNDAKDLKTIINTKVNSAAELVVSLVAVLGCAFYGVLFNE